ncbi:NYN domain-containing protein [Gallalistipes aquisgranensis]|uniref:NYN domain-containing protein n=1 Tax=Gallalistipes aquisgranensis TaxID=2779358 RepID=UPI001CF8E1B2|nr:NYN domain-containing protein [Gallalistipes aquisgranensis]MBE5032839.1 NYN domain-containing protein [Gallalistipes aquisgranensis]
MTNSITPLRLGVFYDGNFLLHASNYYNYIHPLHTRLSISGLHDFIRTRAARAEECPPARCQIAEAHYFRGRINAAEASQRGNQLYNDRVFEDILMAEGIQTHYLPLRNFSGRKEERGIDVWLSLEVFELAIMHRIDVAVLILSDTDYAPLLRKLCSLGVRTMLLSWEFDYQNDEGGKVVTRTSHELLQLATYPIPMHEEIERGLKQGDPLISGLFVGGDNASSSGSGREVSEILSLKDGYGFIKYPNNNLYFHNKDVIGDFADLAPGDTVEFTVERNPQKQQDVAKNVRKLAPEAGDEKEEFPGLYEM